MSLLGTFDVGTTGLVAQSLRLNLIASNVANAETAVSADGQPYRAKQLEFMAAALPGGATGVKAGPVVEDQTPPRLLYNPSHPQANEQGYVAMPNVNVVEEMVNMLSASRSYQTNVDTLNAAKSMALKTLTIGQ